MKTNGKVENDGIGEYKECQTPRLRIRDDQVPVRGSHKSEKRLGDNLRIPKIITTEGGRALGAMWAL